MNSCRIIITIIVILMILLMMTTLLMTMMMSVPAGLGLLFCQLPTNTHNDKVAATQQQVLGQQATTTPIIPV